MTPLIAAVAVVGVVAAISAVGVVAFRQTIYCALSLVANVGSLAVLFLLLNAQFLFAVQLIIYAGAVVVLFIFIIALFNPEDEDRPVLDRRLIVGLGGVIVLTAALFLVASNGTTYDQSGFRAAKVGVNPPGAQCRPDAQATCPDPYGSQSFPADQVNSAGNVQAVGGQLFTTFLLPFEITSLLLLVAAIGAVYLTRHRRSQAQAPTRARARAPGARPRSGNGRFGSELEPGREAGAQPLLLPGEVESSTTREVAP